MTYVSAKSHGVEFSGLGAVFEISHTPNENLRALQQQLQRLGLLAPGTGSTGADGLWGAHTGAAMTGARRLVGYRSPAYSVSGLRVTVPDELIAAIAAHGASATPPSTPAPAPAPSETATTDTTARTTEPDTTVTTPGSTLPRNVSGGGGTTNWPLYGAIGAGILAVGGIAYWMSSKPVRANRRPRRNATKKRKKSHRRRKAIRLSPEESSRLIGGPSYREAEREIAHELRAMNRRSQR